MYSTGHQKASKILKYDKPPIHHDCYTLSEQLPKLQIIDSDLYFPGEEDIESQVELEAAQQERPVNVFLNKFLVFYIVSLQTTKAYAVGLPNFICTVFFLICRPSAAP